jgi:citrate lyase subunit beta/citryl-CoA lyase
MGEEQGLRQLFVKLLHDSDNTCNQAGVRVHPVFSEHFEQDLEVLLSNAAEKIAYITIPKVKSVRDVVWATGLIKHYADKRQATQTIPLHLLIETPEAMRDLTALAALPAVETLDFGIMDFISHAAGAISAECMKSPGQFDHPLLSSVKSEIALAALGAGKTPSHNVTVNVRDPKVAFDDAYRARHSFGFLRMWSIHPTQIEQIIHAMTPTQQELLEAQEIMQRAEQAKWGPIEYNGRLHDRASYRYYWGIISRAS